MWPLTKAHQLMFGACAPNVDVQFVASAPAMCVSLPDCVSTDQYFTTKYSVPTA